MNAMDCAFKIIPPILICNKDLLFMPTLLLNEARLFMLAAFMFKYKRYIEGNFFWMEMLDLNKIRKEMQYVFAIR
jgi:hypothetical protein